MTNDPVCSWNLIKTYTYGNRDRVVGTWRVHMEIGSSFCYVKVDKLAFRFGWSHFIEDAKYIKDSRIAEIQHLDHKEVQPLTAKQLSTLLHIVGQLGLDIFDGQYEPSNLTDKELYEKAVKACQDYRRLYGVYPKKIGIHWERFSRFQFQSRIIHFPELLKRPCVLFYDTLGKIPTELKFKICEVSFGAVTGKEISWDEIYFPVRQSRDKTIVMSSEMLSHLLAIRQEMR